MLAAHPDAASLQILPNGTVYRGQCYRGQCYRGAERRSCRWLANMVHGISGRTVTRWPVLSVPGYRERERRRLRGIKRLIGEQSRCGSIDSARIIFRTQTEKLTQIKRPEKP